jgi:hypothetical protein
MQRRHGRSKRKGLKPTSATFALKTFNSISARVARRYLLWIAAVCLLPFADQAAEKLSPSEYQIKAAFLFNFIKFVEWPPHVASATNSPLIIAVIGQDPFGRDLESVIEGKRINDRPLLVRRFPPDASPGFSHILFVSASERRRIGEICRALEDAPTLIVGDGIEGFCQSGGMLNFVMEGKKVRFETNSRAAERHGLKMSSKLLRLGVPLGAASDK